VISREIKGIDQLRLIPPFDHPFELADYSPQTMAGTAMYFQLDLQLQLLDLAPFGKQLLSCLLHTFRQGVCLAGDAQNRIPIDTTTAAGCLCQRYITKALRKDLDADKLFALRRTGPSMKFIMRHLPPDSPLTAKDIFRK
jgi:hypothetical protein